MIRSILALSAAAIFVSCSSVPDTSATGVAPPKDAAGAASLATKGARMTPAGMAAGAAQDAAASKAKAN